MALSDLFAMIARLFGARAAPTPATSNASISAETLAQPGIEGDAGTNSVPTSADPAASGEPTWLDLCRPLTQFSESCYLTAYPDPGSPLAKALQARGIWTKVLGGMPIPADEVLRKLSGTPWTCGWGQTGTDVKQGTVWTQETADERLEQALAQCGENVDFRVKVPLAPHEKAALVDFTYNVGAGAFGTSTLLKLLNAGDLEGAAAQFAAWNKSGGVVLPGLVVRRERERDLFLTGTWSRS